MSIAPPGYPIHWTDPGSGNRHADDTVQYEFKSVQTLRGRKDSTRAKWQNQGWEFVSEDRGKLRTELNFRRVKPKALGSQLLSMVASFGGSQPKTQAALVASCALLLVAGVGGLVAGTPRGPDPPLPRAAQPRAATAPPQTTASPAAPQTTA